MEKVVANKAEKISNDAPRRTKKRLLLTIVRFGTNTFTVEKKKKKKKTVVLLIP